MQNNKKLKFNTTVSKKVKAPAAIGSVSRVTNPALNTSRGGMSVNISRKEFVGTVSNGATTGFALTPLSVASPGYDLNPACQTLFPWLSQVAPSYERFTFRRLCFHFVPANPTSSTGRVYAAVDYDFDDAVASDKAALMGNVTAAECPVWMELKLETIPRELHRDLPSKFISANSRNNFIEPRTAYCGFLMVAFDTPTANLAYDLWVEYIVELQIPVLEPTLSVSTLGGSPVSVANLAPTGVGPYFGLPYIPPFNSTAVKVVVPGQGVPILDMATLFGAAASASQALDVGTANRDGVLTARWVGNEIGTTPVTLLASNKIASGMAAFNSSGSYLGTVDSVISRVVGPSNPAAVSNASAQVASQFGLYIRDLYGLYATARYLVPYLYSAVASAAGTSAQLLKFEL